MALNIKNAEVERLAEEVARLTGESKPRPFGACPSASSGLPTAHPNDRESRIRRYLEREVWPLVPADEVGRRLTAEEEEPILGFGPDGA